MTNRRDFIKKAALLSGGARVFSSLPASINLELRLINHGASPANITIHDHAYHLGEMKKTVESHAQVSLVIDLSKGHCWYDFSVKVTGNQLFEQRFAGRVETGRESFSDPVIGK